MRVSTHLLFVCCVLRCDDSCSSDDKQCSSTGPMRSAEVSNGAMRFLPEERHHRNTTVLFVCLCVRVFDDFSAPSTENL